MSKLNIQERNTIRNISNSKERRSMGNLSFLGQINEAKNDPRVEKAISNPESRALQIAENIIKDKKLIEIYGLTKENYENYVQDSGEDALVLAAICTELAERRAGLKEAKEETEE